MKKTILFLFTACICFAFSNVQKRIVRENGFDIECFISLKKTNHFNDNKTYYWFKSGRIHNSLANAGGYVLHETCSKYYRSKQIAEQGQFNFGLKNGLWKSWYENGNLKTQEIWNNGYLNGVYKAYNVDGEIILQGKYKNNSKAGMWVDYKAKDTIYYKNDATFKEKPKGLLERFLRKKDSLEKVKIKADRIVKRKNDSIKRVKHKQERRIKKYKDSVIKAKKNRRNNIKKTPRLKGY